MRQPHTGKLSVLVLYVSPCSCGTVHLAVAPASDTIHAAENEGHHSNLTVRVGVGLLYYCQPLNCCDVSASFNQQYILT